MSRQGSSEPVFTVLLVCTGNICRSALAERLGRAYLDDLLGENADRIRLVSAGVGAVVGSGMHPHSALVLQGLGGDPSGFVARQLVDAHAVDADLVLTMTRAHRRRVLALAPRGLARTFTLREAGELNGLVGKDVELPGAGLAERARSLVREMAAARARRHSSKADDVADPIGLSVDAHQVAGEAIARAFLPLLARIAALRVPAAGGPRASGVA